jgi:signal transduction histidine kinase
MQNNMKSLQPFASSTSVVMVVVLVVITLICDIVVDGFTMNVLYNNHRRHASLSITTLHAKRVSFKEDARRGLVSGINQVANAVRVTLGPKVRLLYI